MRKDSINYCSQCDTCQHTTYSTQAPQGLTRPLPIPHQPFTHLAMNFLSLPPKVRTERGKQTIYDTVWTIVERFSSYVTIIPLTKDVKAEELVIKFIHFIDSDWGMPKDIVSDMDPKFTSKAWKTFCDDNNIHQSMSTTYYPRNDEQAK